MTDADDDKAATRHEMRELQAELKAEIDEVRGAIAANADAIAANADAIAANANAIAANADAIAANRDAILATRQDLLLEIGASAARTANVIIDHVRDMFRAFDDKYRDLPGRVKAVEEALRVHIADDARHVKA